MKQCKYGNPKRKSRFICLKCLTENQMGGFQRLNGQREKGHEEERWHWSYYPLASVFMKEFADIMTDEDLKGFSGDKYISSLNVIENFVLGVAPEPTAL